MAVPACERLKWGRKCFLRPSGSREEPRVAQAACSVLGHHPGISSSRPSERLQAARLTSSRCRFQSLGNRRIRVDVADQAQDKGEYLLPLDLPFPSPVSVTTSCAGLVVSPAKEGQNRCRHDTDRQV